MDPWDLPTRLIEPGTTVKTAPNSVKYRPTRRYGHRPLQHSGELHQKDLRINQYFMHIQGPENEAVSEADTFRALSLIVEFYTSGGSH